MKNFSLSVIVPVYNEVQIIKESVSKIFQYLKTNFSDFEIIIVDDGSSDGTYNIALGLSDKIKHLKVIRNDNNYGKGYSIRRGIFASNFDYILFIDADLSTPIEELDKFTTCLTEGADILVGSRKHKDSQILRPQFFLRRNMGRIFNLLVQVFLFKGAGDVMCGFKLFKRKAALDLFKRQTVNRFCFDAEILYIAKNLGYSIKKIPVKWSDGAKTSVVLCKDAPRAFLDLLFIKKNYLQGLYNLESALD